MSKDITLINPIFEPRDLASVLAHAESHSVIGLTLPPIDANLFHQPCRLVRSLGEEVFAVDCSYASGCGTRRGPRFSTSTKPLSAQASLHHLLQSLSN